MSDGVLDVLALPIRGTQFIEAGAGTGKTHTICNLFVRLIVETGLPVDSILVLTFTRAATAELRERIESRLRQLSAALRGGQVAADDAFAVDLLARIDDVARVRRRLDLALAGFDVAPIHTIHGFCQRALADHALLSRAVFSAELLEDESELRRQIARDFWRREINGAGRMFVDYVIRHVAADPEQLLQRLTRTLARPYVTIRGGEPAPACSPIELAFETAFASAGQAWRAGRDQLSQILLDSTALNRNVYRVGSMRGWVARLDRTFADGAAARLMLPEELTRLTPKALARGVRKGSEPPVHPFFGRCETLLNRAGELRDCLRRAALSLQRRFIDYCNAELQARKHAAGVQAFDDLLRGLREALCAENAGALRESLRRQYRAALIDEFQDTDPLQYEIFHSIYAGSDLPLYLVGDPKQAIYAFRGADVYAYLRARREMGDATHALTVNWRSDPGLIEAVNVMFASAPLPFRDPEIAFRPASPAPRARPRLTIDGQAATPMVFWLLEREGQAAPMNKLQAGALASEAVAGEIARLLSCGDGRHAITGVDGHASPLSGRDIAVLVRTRAQGAQVRRALSAHGVDSVELSDSSVFDTVEAEALTHVLRAIASPGDDTCVRTALATDLLRDAGTDLFLLIQDEQAWEQVVLRFDGYHRLWREQGFFAMWQCFLDSEGVLARLLGRVAGARQATNLAHLVELLQREAAAGRAGITALIDWLFEQRTQHAARDEASLLRLESDADLVSIVTIHRSKGLEYPIVFCPYLWDDGARPPDGDAPVFFHDPAHENAPTLALDGSDVEAARHAGEESRAESMRLLYVALTRARHRCHVVWGAVKSAAASAPAWLLHRHRRPGADDAALADWFNAASDAELRAELAAIAESVPGAIAVSALPPARPPTSQRAASIGAPPLARRFAGRIPAPWRLTSYSTVVRRASDSAPDHDAGAQSGGVVTPIDGAATGMFAFPRGARAGSCLHAMFEHVDFTDRSGWRGVVATELKRFGFSGEWRDTAVAMIDEVMRATLGPGGPRLGEVSARQRLNELEFDFPFRHLDPRRLAARVAPYDRDGGLRRQLMTLQPERVGGYLKGFVDMVFECRGRWYIVDYKSNWLGPQRDDYLPGRLRQVMVDECYGLQYLIYLVALHRWLRQRLPGYDYETHVGGVFYLFVRAVGPVGDAGIFHDRPELALLQAFDDSLREGSES